MLSFKQGTIKKFLPPFFIKTSLARRLISSNVSMQSEEKPGEITKTFFFPSSGNFSIVFPLFQPCRAIWMPDSESFVDFQRQKLNSLRFSNFSQSVSNLQSVLGAAGATEKVTTGATVDLTVSWESLETNLRF